MTVRLWWADTACRQFTARVITVEGDGTRVVLERSAFYPTAGGQPHDTGRLAGIRVVEVEDHDTHLVHVLAAPLPAGTVEVDGVVDDARRTDHSEQHTGQHLLSAILEDRFRRPTVAFHLGAEVTTIDVGGMGLGPAQFADVEMAVAEAIRADLPVTSAVLDDVRGLALRKPTDRTGPVRVVTIAGLDLNACGGTHVSSTGALGALILLGTEKVRDATRVTFVAGGRAVRRIRADRELLAATAAVLGCAADELPALVAKQQAALLDAEKALRPLRKAAAEREARDHHAATPPDAAGRRVLRLTLPGVLDDATRTLAQAYAALPGGVALVSAAEGRTVLLAAAPDARLDCGALLKGALAAAGGRGGGQPGLAQGSVPDATAFATVVAALEAALR